MEGNARFLRGERRFTQAPIEILADLIEGQHPFAVILGCSDLRVPPELIFDAKFGDLFVIRVAGNVVSPEVWGSLQYAGTHLKTQLVMVLGHEGCGAVQAALAVKFQGAQERSRIQLLLQNMLPGSTRSTRSFRHGKGSSAQSRPMSIGPCVNSARRPKGAHEWQRAA